jgi:hypothetical protein
MPTCFIIALVIAGSGCDGGGDRDGAPDGDGRTTFGWRAVDSGVTPVWGGFVAEGGADPILVGGVAGTGGPVIDTAEIPEVRGDRMVSSLLPLDGPRYCGCGFVDATRNELIVIGGRDGRFLDVETAVVIDLDDGTASPIADADAGPAAFPIGCVAFFLPATGTGYVYSGLSSNQRAFGAGLFRWDGAARTFVAVDVAGARPAPRYDAAVHVEADGGSALVVSGMGAGAPVFHQDTWRFAGSTETWTEVATTNPPPGRRYAWSALAPDGDTLVFGFGSDSPQGLTLLADLWRLSLGSGVWSRLDDDVSAFDVDTALPARGFASRLPGLPGTAGLLSGGMQDGVLAEDAFVLDVPAALDGEWR